MAKACRSCGIPSIVSRDQLWEPNGTIVGTKSPTFRLALMESPHFLSLTSTLERTFGDVITNCFSQGTRKNARTYIDGLLSGPIGYIARSRLGSRKAFDALVETCLGLGYGRPTITSYTRKKAITVEIEDTIYPPLFLGDLRGAFESIERVPTLGKFEALSKTRTMFTVQASDKEDPLEDRFNHYDKSVDRTAQELKACGSCGLPTALTRFKWDTERFQIIDTVMGERAFLFGFNDLIAILHELEVLVGDLMRGMVRDLTVPFGQAIGKKFGDKSFDFMVDDMRVKGMGHMKYTQKGKDVTWEIHNPFYTPILEGKLAGIYTELMGREPKVQLKKEKAVLTITMA